jgi:hypothetical protein
VTCILKWEKEEQQKIFEEKVSKMFSDKTPLVKEFQRIVDLKSMTKDKLITL